MKKLLIIILLITGVYACDKERPEKKISLKSLYQTYKAGEITAYTYNGRMVYMASLNVYDAGYIIYDEEGSILGDCNYSWNNVDPLCKDLIKVETIYRCVGHISGQPAIDKYNLARSID